MKKVILAVDNEKILEKFNIKEIKQEKVNIKKIQYREGIIEILKIYKKIDTIILSENLPGKINIEDLIKKIKIINKNINIIFILEKNDIKKEEKLEKLKINYIYKLENKREKNKKNKIDKKQKSKVIIFFGEKNQVTTIIYLIFFYLIQKKKKILLIKLKKEDTNSKNFLIRNKLKKFLINENEKNINKALNKKIEKNKKFFDYILIDSCNIKDKNIIDNLLKRKNKKIYVLENNFLEIKKCKDFIKKTLGKNKDKKNLYIILNKYSFCSISNFILKSIFGKFLNIYKMMSNKNYSELEEKILKENKIKIRYKNKIILKKIIN